jgi:hypothetical protein
MPFQRGNAIPELLNLPYTAEGWRVRQGNTTHAEKSMATHVIQFRDKEKYKEAIMALLDVPVSRSAIPGLKMIVEEEHIQALKRANVEFNDITKRIGRNGAAPVQP